ARRLLMKAERVQVFLPEHVVQVNPRTWGLNAGTRSVRASDARGVAIRIENRDVRRRSDRISLGRCTFATLFRSATKHCFHCLIDVRTRQKALCEALLLEALVEIPAARA